MDDGRNAQEGMLMRLGKYAKLPVERKRYTVDYNEWLDEGETILAVVPYVEGVADDFYVDGIVVGTSGRDIVFFVSGGYEGKSYNLVIEITTSGEQIKSDHIIFVVQSDGLA